MIEGLECARLAGDSTAIAQSLHGLGVVAISLGEYEEARRVTEEALVIRRKIEDRHGMAYALNNLGNISAVSGDLRGAQRFFTESQDLEPDSRGVVE